MELSSNEQFAALIEKIAKEIRKKGCFVSAATQISMREMHVLIFIKEKHESKMQEIASYLEITMPTATVLLDGLIAKNLVKRNHDPKDRRSVLIQLTSKGKELLEKAISHRNEKINKVFSYLTDEESKNLVQILNNLLNRLTENNE